MAKNKPKGLEALRDVEVTQVVEMEAAPVVELPAFSFNVQELDKTLEEGHSLLNQRERCYIIVAKIAAERAKKETFIRETRRSGSEAGKLLQEKIALRNAKLAEKLNLEKQCLGYEVDGVVIPPAPEGTPIHSVLKKARVQLEDLEREIADFERRLSSTFDTTIRALEKEAAQMGAKDLILKDQAKANQVNSRRATQAAKA